MSPIIRLGMSATWLFLLAFWLLTGRRTKPVRTQEGPAVRFVLYWLPLLAAFFLMGPGPWFGHGWLREQFVEHTDLVGMIGLSLAIVGAAIACISRHLLGRNWSLSVQHKEDHELVQDGPYAVIRHPIYTGLLLMFTGNALIVGDRRALVAVAVIFISFWIKLRKEEAVLGEAFGAKYSDYKSRTKALVPFIL